MVGDMKEVKDTPSVKSSESEGKSEHTIGETGKEKLLEVKDIAVDTLVKVADKAAETLGFPREKIQVNLDDIVFKTGDYKVLTDDQLSHSKASTIEKLGEIKEKTEEKFSDLKLKTFETLENVKKETKEEIEALKDKAHEIKEKIFGHSEKTK